MARAMAARYGMEPDLGQATYLSQQPLYLDPRGLKPQQAEGSDETNARIDQAIRDLIAQAFAYAQAILRECAEIERSR